MRRSVPALVVLAVLAVHPPHAADRQVRSWPLDPATTIVLVEDHRAPLVEVVLEFPAGAWSPWVQDNHAVEAFEIQTYDSSRSFRARADALAADLDASVGDHASTVHAACLRDDLEDILQLVRDVLENDDFDKAELKRRKRSRGIEWKSAQKIPEFRLSQATARLFFAETDPRRSRYEKPGKLITDSRRLAAARDAVLRLPGRVIAFAGALTEADARRLAPGLLPPADEGTPDSLDPLLQPMTDPAERPAELRQAMKRINQSFFHYGRDSPTYEDPRYAAFLIADHVLGGHFHSRISTALRHEGGETYSAYTRGEGGPHQAAYGLDTFTRAENSEVTADKLRGTLAVFHERGITEEEREAAAGFLLGRRPFSRQSPGQILGRYLWERRNGLPPGFYDDLVDRAVETPLEAINDLVSDFFDPANFTLVEVRPK